MRRSRAALVISVVSGVLAVVALAVMLYSGYAVADINSPAGRQQLDGFGAAAWGIWTMIHEYAVIALVVTGASFVLATVMHLRGRVIPPPPPPSPPEPLP
jgi:hypothetical protein